MCWYKPEDKRREKREKAERRKKTEEKEKRKYKDGAAQLSCVCVCVKNTYVI